MKLRYLRVQGFKNIVDCEVEFPADQRLNAFIGMNGSGKSNLIEAILHILLDVYFRRRPSFDFELRYETQGRDVQINCFAKRVTIQVDGRYQNKNTFADRLRDGQSQVFYPELTFVYYSGECQRVRRLVNRYRSHFHRSAGDRDLDVRLPLFVQASNEQAKSILLALFAHGESKVLNLLRIERLTEVSITVRSPQGFDPDVDEPKLWNTQGFVREAINAFSDTSDWQDDTPNQAEELPLLVADDSLRERPRRSRMPSYREDRTYRYESRGGANNSFLGLGERLAGLRTNLYLALQALSHRMMLINIDFEMVATDGKTFAFEQLSEGEKQLLSVIGSLRLTNQRENLVLLDEPDTHLNPGWSWDYMDHLRYALHAEQMEGSTVLMTTHDPVMISGMVREQVWIASSQNGQGVRFTHPHRHPRGQGVANILCSDEFYGLPSSLDKRTQELLDKRLEISIKDELTDDDRIELRELNQKLEILTPGISERDSEFVDFLRQKYKRDETR